MQTPRQQSPAHLNCSPGSRAAKAQRCPQPWAPGTASGPWSPSPLTTLQALVQSPLLGFTTPVLSKEASNTPEPPQVLQHLPARQPPQPALGRPGADPLLSAPRSILRAPLLRTTMHHAILDRCELALCLFPRGEFRERMLCPQMAEEDPLGQMQCNRGHCQPRAVL